MGAVASIGVSLARSGFGLTLLTEDGEPLGAAGIPVTEGALLDALATVEPGTRRGMGAALDRLARRGVDGVLVAVLADTDLDDVERLARLRQGSSGCVAVLLDTASWAGAWREGKTSRRPLASRG